MSLADVFESRARWTVEPCDCHFGMSSLPANSVDAIVCDPPYGIEFMGKKWDSFSATGTEKRRASKARKSSAVPIGKHGRPGELSVASIPYDRTRRGNQRFQRWVTQWAIEAFRVAKPGAHLVAFGGPRTWHRLAAGIENAGWELRDNLAWMFGSGFPKSRNISKDIDRQLGAARKVVGYQTLTGSAALSIEEKGGTYSSATTSNGKSKTIALTRAGSDEAAEAEGYGTGLKPSFEPCVLARKPMRGSISRNFRNHGTGALNIDACRIESGQDHADKCASVIGLSSNRNGVDYGEWAGEREDSFSPLGRWPANVVLDEEAAAILDAQAGDHPGMSGGGIHRADYQGGMFGTIDCATNARGDSGGPSRFFYTAKASRSERDAGLDDFAPRTAGEATARTDDTDGLASPRAGAGRTGGARNVHPTVKPVDLMRWLVRLVGRPNALILDPFTGSGSTGVAAMLEGMRFVGFELEPLHVDFARARIAHVVGGTWEREVAMKVEKRQPSLFDAIGGGK